MNTALAEIPIIDIDTHFTEPKDLWLRRAPAKLRDVAPRVAVNADGKQQWVVEDLALGPPGFCVIDKQGAKTYGTFSLDNFEAMTDAATLPEARLASMDELGLDVQILYPNILGFAGSRIMQVKDPDVRNFCVTAYNDAVADLQSDGKGRLYPQALLPFWDLELAVRELERCHDELSLTGFTMTDAPEQWQLPYLHDGFWDPLWSTAQERGLPVNFHIGSGTSVSPWKGLGNNRSLAAVSTMMFMNNMRCLTNLIFSGLLDRFPSLNFVSVESGVGWLPFMLESCEYQMDENLIDRGGLELRPMEYFKRQIYASFWFEKTSIAHTVEVLGNGNIMFETDFPHPTCLYPGVRDHVEACLGDQDRQTQENILFRTAANVYGITLNN